MCLKQLQRFILIMFMLSISIICLAGSSIKYDFESSKNSKYWKSWGITTPKIKRIKSDRGGYALQFTNEKLWNTAIFSFEPPFTVTEKTALRFKIKTSKAGGWKILFTNASEGAEYAAHFAVKEANKWTDIQIPLKNAVYRRHGKPGAKIDGIIGDKLLSAQIAYLGKKMVLDDVELLNISDAEFKQLKSNHPEIEAYLKSHKKVIYRQLARNGVFPFGVILTQRGEQKNAKTFDQKLINRYEYDLLAIKRGGFNALADFCTRFKTEIHMKLMEYYHLYLLNTATCGSKIYTLPKNHSKFETIKKFSNHPNLIGWYGQDEPRDFNAYLKNKSSVETASGGGAPYTSAMHATSAIPLAPCMNVVIIDPYSLITPFDPVNSSSVLQKHRFHIDNTRGKTRQKRVWVIAQAFSRRDDNRRLQRFPRPVEVRFDVFNYIAAGASGFMFFIANDTVPYLDREYRGQEFDQTLFDAWGNVNATTKELGDIARRITPIMPSFLDIEKSTKLKVSCTNKKILVSQWENELGSLVFCVNSNLSLTLPVKIKFTLPKSSKIYDLETLKPFKTVSLRLNMRPGDGRLFLITDESRFQKTVREINSRKSSVRWESLDIKLKVLKKAGFDTSKIRKQLDAVKPTGKTISVVIPENTFNKLAEEIDSLRGTNAVYCSMQSKLKRIKETFGRINAKLVATGVIERIDKNSQWFDIFDKIQKSGQTYFKIYQDWSEGKLKTSQEELPLLMKATDDLEKQVAAKLRENSIKADPLW